MIKAILLAILISQVVLIKLRNDQIHSVIDSDLKKNHSNANDTNATMNHTMPIIANHTYMRAPIPVEHPSANNTNATMNHTMPISANHSYMRAHRRIVMDDINNTNVTDNHTMPIPTNHSYMRAPIWIEINSTNTTNVTANHTMPIPTNHSYLRAPVPIDTDCSNHTNSTTNKTNTSAVLLEIPSDNTTMTPSTPDDKDKDKKKDKEKKKDDDDDDKDKDKDDDKKDKDKKDKKKKNKKKKTKKSLSFKNNTFTLKHCSSYSVNGYFTNFGCYECESGYQLSSDLNGIGTCKGKTTITNCKAEIQLGNDTLSTKCVQCEMGFSANSTGKECKELNKTQPLIDNCQSYFIDENAILTCGRCTKGFTLSMDGSSCATPCNITNCDNCVDLDSAQYCNACSPGFIGVLGYPFNMISKCITTTDWLKKIFANSIIEELL